MGNKMPDDYPKIIFKPIADNIEIDRPMCKCGHSVYLHDRSGCRSVMCSCPFFRLNILETPQDEEV